MRSSDFCGHQFINNEFTISSEVRKYCSLGSDKTNVFKSVSKSPAFTLTRGLLKPIKIPFSEKPFNVAIPFSNHSVKMVESLGKMENSSRATNCCLGFEVYGP